ncbi:tyrosine-type recombinase/integrase [Actinoalloteichus hymeniacidonis]|uniref:Site-specific recombinase XerD n=1 Tax=Actinoalloteichus hymeniacidonis TaxID=340345 RepID=A0AAC9HQW2_9PSEU|nr:site-specific integrase [Actinoalloteichus hymeniacidonis]AOS63922.1 site-specific recombinase XerD [Actinoalloteichus hymeniacidonis]MBB5908022.1 integrase/recombinase XerC [Actinoalloteichus hymeniacidonis]
MGAIDEGRARRVLAEYEQTLAESTLAPQTRRAYRSRIAGFLAWLAADHETTSVDPLTDPAGRDAAVSGYRARLRGAQRSRPATINAVLTALDHFYEGLGLGPAPADREEAPDAEPRVLQQDELDRLLPLVGRVASGRDAAIVYTLLYTGVRVTELVALDTGDVRLGARPPRLVVVGPEHGPREIPLPDEPRPILREWLAIRREWPNTDRTSALFLNRRGGRLSTRSVDASVAWLGSLAGLVDERGRRITPHVLRRTFGHRLLRAGVDQVTVAELMGHRRLTTTRRYGAASPSQTRR